MADETMLTRMIVSTDHLLSQPRSKMPAKLMSACMHCTTAFRANCFMLWK